jgi:RHS repeat-associated protein
MTTTFGSVYYHHDGLDNTIAITNGNAEVLERYSYDVFGQVTVVDASTGNTVPQSAHGVRHFYTGHDFQAELGLYLTHYRAYEPNLGRWLSADPIGEKGGWNLYGYVGNRAVNLVDIEGLQPGNRYDPSQGTSKGNKGQPLDPCLKSALIGAVANGLAQGAIGSFGGPIGTGIGFGAGFVRGAIQGAIAGGVVGAVNK